MDKIEKMINAFKTRTIKSAIEGLVVEHNDIITNAVKAYLDNLSQDEIANIKIYLETLLDYCYNGEILHTKLKKGDLKLIEKLNSQEKFLLKESIIYFYGRLTIPPDIDIIKKIYKADDNKYIKLNITFASLPSFNEDIELDFTKRLLTNKVYDLMVRSWTMAFFKGVKNPYEYKDKETDDWTPAKIPRIKRLSINDIENPKYKKAMSFRLLDLVVIYIFIKSRKKNDLTGEEKQIIKNAKIDYGEYSKNKKEMIKKLKEMILNYK